MLSTTHAEDPCPQIPQTFVDPVRMNELSRGIKGFSTLDEEELEPLGEAPEDRPEKPQILVRSVVATRAGLEAFGRRLIAAAYVRGFNAAPRKAFLADGAASNWSVHRAHFSHYTPILDFTHAICYVWAAAMAARSAAAGWRDYCQWAQWLWAGQTEELLAAVWQRKEELGALTEGESETSPRHILTNTWSYLNHQRERMKYAEYRRAGLPITSSHIESTIKQVNRRVKGTEKFWDQGAEPLLQLVADHLSENGDLLRFWKNRPQQLAATRNYRTAA